MYYRIQGYLNLRFKGAYFQGGLLLLFFVWGGGGYYRNITVELCSPTQ